MALLVVSIPAFRCMQFPARHANWRYVHGAGLDFTPTFNFPQTTRLDNRAQDIGLQDAAIAV